MARPKIHANRVNQCIVSRAIHHFVGSKPVNAVANAGCGNRRQHTPGSLVNTGCAQSRGARRQLRFGNSAVANKSHPQSMAEQRRIE